MLAVLESDKIGRLAGVLEENNRVAADGLREAVKADVQVRNVLSSAKAVGNQISVLGREMERESRMERVARVERIERIPRTERTERAERIERVERTPRVTRIERVPRTPRVERTTRTPRTERTPRIPRVPRIERVPRILKEPKKFIPHIWLKGGRELTPNELEAAVAWKQGIMYKLIYPPYGQGDILNSRHPFPGMHIHTGPNSAFETLIKTQRGRLPSTIVRDMGMMHIRIEGGDKKFGQIKMKFAEQEQRKGKGATTGRDSTKESEVLTKV